MSQILDEIKEELKRPCSYQRLLEMEASLLHGKEVRQLSLDEGLTIGNILNRRHEWFRAMCFYQALSASFPECLELSYEFMLLCIDGGNYSLGKDVLETKLAPQLQAMDERYLRGVLRGAGQLGIHEASLAAWEVLRGRQSEYATDGVRLRIDTAIANSRRIDRDVISLGENCLPWIVPNRWGLRRRPWVSGCSSMFDLGQTTTERCAAILADHGESLVAPQNIVTRHFPSETPFPVNRTVGYDFNHQQGEYWIQNDYENLVAKYRVRLRQFKANLESNRPVLLHYSEHAGDFQKIVDAVERRLDGRDFRLIILDVNPDRRFDLKIPEKKIFYRKLHLPYQQYTWFKPADFDSDAGLNWERTMEQFILDVMSS